MRATLSRVRRRVNMGRGRREVKAARAQYTSNLALRLLGHR